jgi:hypothetical protein
MEETSQEFTFTGTLIEGPDIDLIEISGLQLSEDDEELLWSENDRRQFLIDNELCEEIELEGEEDESDIPGMSDSLYEYCCGARDDFVASLRSAILEELERLRKKHIAPDGDLRAKRLPAAGHRVKRAEGVELTVTWGNDVEVSLRLTPRNWSRLQRGQSFRIRGKGYTYEGEFFWDYWTFTNGVGGDLLVEYGEDGGVGFEGKLADVPRFASWRKKVAGRGFQNQRAAARTIKKPRL